MKTFTPLMQQLRSALQQAVAAARWSQLQALQQPLTMPAPIETQKAPPAPQWHVMPGLVIELGDTGFQVAMNLGKATPKLPSRFTVINPEGLIECWGMGLASAKQHAESLARERAEFVWRPAKGASA